MNASDSLQDIINELPLSFINRVIKETDVVKLRHMLARYHCYNRREVIRARIANLNHLVI